MAKSMTALMEWKKVAMMAALWVSAIIASWAGNHNGDSDGCIDGVEEG